METITRENIQIRSDNRIVVLEDEGGVIGRVAARPGEVDSTAAAGLTQSNVSIVDCCEVRDEKSQNDKSVQSQSQPSKQPATALGLRAWFRKSNTCGSLYAKCNCKHHGLSSSGSHSVESPEGVNKTIVGSEHNRSRPISTSEKDFRKIKLLEAFTHPDTPTVFTQENKYASNLSESPSRSQITSVQTGGFEILHSTHSKRLSTPSFGSHYKPFHPEFVVKKLGPKSALSNEEKTPSISIPSPRRSTLKKSHKSFPGLSPSDSSAEFVSHSLKHNFSASSSVDESQEDCPDELCDRQTSGSEDLSSSHESYISFTAGRNPLFNNGNIRQLSLKYAGITGTNILAPKISPNPEKTPTKEEQPPVCENHVLLVNPIQADPSIVSSESIPSALPNNQCFSDSACESDQSLDESGPNSSSSNNNSDNGNSVTNFQVPSVKSAASTPTKEPPATKLNPSAQEFFIQSGILGPMGNGSSVLNRKTSKIVPNVDAPVKEKIRKNSKLLFGKRTVLSDGRRKSIPQSGFNCDSFQSYGSTPTLNSQTNNGPKGAVAKAEDEIHGLRQLLKIRDEEINRLKREIDKLKSVLQQTATTSLDRQQQLENSTASSHQNEQQSSCKSSTEGDLLSSIQANYVMAGQQLPMSELYGVPGKGFNLKQNGGGAGGIIHNGTGNGNAGQYQINNNRTSVLLAMKRHGVSGESCEVMGSASDIKIPKYDKDYSAKQLIKDAILDNDFFKNIDSLQIREIVDSMYSREFQSGEYVIHEGQAGSHLYVSATGEFEVLKEGKNLGTMGPGKAFGELAILYNCTRTASIRAFTNARVWVLDRKVFQQIMMRTGMQRIEENVSFLRSVPLLKNLSNDVLTKIADVLEVEFYPAGTYIIRQGAAGDTFFLISQGTVKVTQRLPGCSTEEEIRILGRGEYFGEKALIKEEKRTANIIAMSPGVECLTLDRESFTKHIGDLCELHEKDYGDEQRVLASRNLENQTMSLDSVNPELMDVEMSDLVKVGTLGVGGFGRVELVKLERGSVVQVYALKCMKKKHIVDTRQQEHVHSERKIMISCLSPFICRLYRTFRDDRYIYMLLEACMGGEVWTILRDKSNFDDGTARFIVGCVLKAFEFLHSRGIVYRDLKPENLLLDSKGYVKLVDFGFAKFIGYSNKTWTFCGTPEYVAPEIVLNKGHDRAVDCWALGVLIHELLTGIPPFASSDPMKTYNIILKGIDMVNFPKYMSRSAISLIKRLCRDIPSERLGYQRGGVQDIKKHKWFQGFDWEGLSNLTLKSPLAPRLKGPLDMSNFDAFPPEASTPPIETSGWDAGF
ncbi:cGMP-dependent protein kinase, isozyme 1-like [Uranotaenia lowii]|uniref:cGMP-dependent protein kinase, isozyme 1-like n=1 Tax=Uranotaenia lowii TaxID=190385 RepID=UPI002478D5B0|nr:cGMP-dependent protein kinase, isozyme 1-like [Uranotaenia lowii]